MRYTLIKKDNLDEVATDCLIVPVTGKTCGLKQIKSDLLKHLDKLTKGTILQALKQDDLAAKAGNYLLIPAPQGLKAKRLLLVHAGANNKLKGKNAVSLINGIASALATMKARSATITFKELQLAEQSAEWLIRQTVLMLEAAVYKFTICKGNQVEERSSLGAISIAPPADDKITNTMLKEAKAIATGIKLTKDLGNLPGNKCTPTYLAESAIEMGKEHETLKVSILNEERMKKLGMGAFLSVTAGTKEPAQMIVFEYKGGKKEAPPIALVGKGITFDSGGISLKPGAAMDEMKFDMCGAATVFGVFQAVLSMALPINLVGIIAAAENMPSGTATKPGDVVTSMSGQTIEVLNTDAEGRLVLCDAITYSANFKPKYVIDMATLTGACVVALGAHASGLYANNEELAEKLLTAGEISRDRAWRMPLWDDYQKQIDSRVADIANIGGSGGGSITAACFLARFANDLNWAHFDIAGTAWNSKKDATGRPVALLCEFLLAENCSG